MAKINCGQQTKDDGVSTEVAALRSNTNRKKPRPEVSFGKEVYATGDWYVREMFVDGQLRYYSVGRRNRIGGGTFRVGLDEAIAESHKRAGTTRWFPDATLPNIETIGSDIFQRLFAESERAIADRRASPWKPPVDDVEAATRRARAQILHEQNNPCLANRLVMAIPLPIRMAMAATIVWFAHDNWIFPSLYDRHQIERIVALYGVFSIGIPACLLVVAPRTFLASIPVVILWFGGHLLGALAMPFLGIGTLVYSIVAFGLLRADSYSAHKALRLPFLFKKDHPYPFNWGFLVEIVTLTLIGAATLFAIISVFTWFR